MQTTEFLLANQLQEGIPPDPLKFEFHHSKAQHPEEKSPSVAEIKSDDEADNSSSSQKSN